MSYSGFWKRFFDLFLALLMTVILLVPSIIVAIIIKFTSNGPVIYKQTRVGKNNQLFTIYKFRTMKINAPVVESSVRVDRQFRTKFGKFIRRYSIDEWPQIINVIKAEMSFIGPRPMLPNSKVVSLRKAYPQIIKLRPGLSGLAQVEGRNSISAEEKVGYDLEYANAISFGQDFSIFFKTLTEILFSVDIFGRKK